MAPRKLPTDDPATPTAAIKARARQLGFELVGIAPAERPEHGDFYLEWLERHYHGEMGYLARDDAVARRLNPAEALPGARSLIVVAMNYADRENGPPDDLGLSVIARYARGIDYHTVFEEKLEQLAGAIRELAGNTADTRCYVDYGPVLERDHAQRAGIGWIGKNTCLIHPDIGSYIFVGEVLTTAELQTDDPFLPDHCGTCDRCIWACPTGAIEGPRVLDARLCISYLTIELRGPIPIALRPAIGNRVFGCDICQEVCPWNKEAPQTNEPGFRPRDDIGGAELVQLMGLSEKEFAARFTDTPLARAKRRGLLRNVAVALGNWADPAAIPALVDALNDDDPLVRGHAAWALGRIDRPETAKALEFRFPLEEDGWVRTEIGLALAGD
ncbi:MAG: tRNA epoxyqueuosine(34) reductase QueG [Gemmatimonadetes bacterium]|nr:tRNA epoxyqueuosine(34) reductase QueG [Gemmatimonadota bacterium]NIO30640.1 tRNA epoxyqueuosine(34) reductase QueG [Gemmatimonadota bacterium]